MGITAEITTDYHSALAALAWQLDMGVDEALGETPQSAYDLPDKAEWQKTAVRNVPAVQPIAAAPAMIQTSPSAAIDAAQLAAQQCQTLEDLRSAMQVFEHLEIKKGARSFVFGAGNPQAHIFIMGDGPNRDDEQSAKPFAGPAGQLLDNMFAAIGFGRENHDPVHALYTACALPWRTPHDRAPEADEIAIMRPFMQRQIELVAPQVVVLMGEAAMHMAQNLGSISRARGNWSAAFGVAAIPIFSPAFLLANVERKRQAWDDLLAIKARLQ